jgi:hypothetical protein
MAKDDDDGTGLVLGLLFVPLLYIGIAAVIGGGAAYWLLLQF